MLTQVWIERTEGILTGVAGSAPEGVRVPGGGIEFPSEYVLYCAKKLKSRIVMSCPRCVDSVGIRILWLRSS